MFTPHHVKHVTCHVWCIMCDVWCVMCDVSGVSCQVSPFFCWQISRASRLRVCYQRGLTCLVLFNPYHTLSILYIILYNLCKVQPYKTNIFLKYLDDIWHQSVRVGEISEPWFHFQMFSTSVGPEWFYGEVSFLSQVQKARGIPNM